jgi:hypothetical protein
MFRLTQEEAELSRSQFAILNSGRGSNIKYLPHAFSEHGAIQAVNVLNSPRAVETGVYVVRAFVKLRELLASNKEFARRLDELEARIEKLTTHDQAIAVIVSAIRQLMNPPTPKRRPIGFTPISGRTSSCIFCALKKPMAITRNERPPAVLNSTGEYEGLKRDRRALSVGAATALARPLDSSV